MRAENGFQDRRQPLTEDETGLSSAFIRLLSRRRNNSNGNSGVNTIGKLKQITLSRLRRSNFKSVYRISILKRVARDAAQGSLSTRVLFVESDIGSHRYSVVKSVEVTRNIDVIYFNPLPYPLMHQAFSVPNQSW
jgi:hypothetical protein